MHHRPLVRSIAAVISALAITAGTAGCTAATSASTPTPTSTATAWSYDGATGPAHWDDVAKTCANTTDAHESPIDIQTAQLKADPNAKPVVLDYVPSEFEVENTGHTVEAVPKDLKADSVTLDGTTYYLQQFHFHVSSEHTVDGKASAGELHLVNKSAKGEVLVLGVFLQTGADATGLDELLSEIPSKVTPAGGSGEELKKTIDPSAFIPAGSASAQYDGSLTTPPCTEGVRWNVYLTPTTVSAAQLAELTAAYPDNHRPVQPLHGRTVTKVPAAK